KQFLKAVRAKELQARLSPGGDREAGRVRGPVPPVQVDQGTQVRTIEVVASVQVDDQRPWLAVEHLQRQGMNRRTLPKRPPPLEVNAVAGAGPTDARRRPGRHGRFLPVQVQGRTSSVQVDHQPWWDNRKRGERPDAEPRSL